MLHLEGEKRFTQPRDRVFARLTDLSFLVQCLPDLHQVKEVKETTAAAVLRPGFSFARGEMQLSIEKLEASPPASARFLLRTKAIGSSTEVETSLSLIDEGTATKVSWSADVKQLGGLLKAVPAGLIQGGAQRVVGQMLENLAKRLNEQG
jgi:carbon monoxide dehydrogenase subunit G